MQETILRPIQGATQAVAISSISASNSTPFVQDQIRLLSTVDCFVVITKGTDLVATVAGNMPLLANVPEYFACELCSNIAAITAGGSGTLYVTEMAFS